MPLRKAAVYLLSSDLKLKRSAITDANGRYEIGDLPPGGYTLTGSKAGYLSAAFGQLGPFGIGRPIELPHGTSLTSVDLRLPRASVIAGQVVDDFGEPLANARVSALRSSASAISPVAAATTNDIGEFRLFDLKPGKYFVVARPPTGSPVTGTVDVPLGYAPSYYPGTPDLSAAERVTVAQGQEMRDIRIPLTTAALSQISGTASDSRGRLVNGHNVSVAQVIGTMTYPVGNAAIGIDGSFRTAAIPPGRYILSVGLPPTQASGPEFASTEVKVGAGGVAGVTLLTQGLAMASGRITVPDRSSLSAAALRIVATPVVAKDRVGGLGAGQGRVNSDLTFSVATRVGVSQVEVAGLPSTLAVESVVFNGVDVTDTGVEFTPNRDIEGIEIRLTDQVTHVSVQVMDNRGRAVAGCPVTVFAQDSTRWTDQSRYVRTERADRMGTAKFSRLPPGDYFVVALSDIDPGLATDPDYMRSAVSKSTPMSLRGAETKIVTLTIVDSSR